MADPKSNKVSNKQCVFGYLLNVIYIFSTIMAGYTIVTDDGPRYGEMCS